MEDVMVKLREPRVAVFVRPSQLVFYSQTPSTHIQELRVYNPHDIPLRFEVFLISPGGRGHFEVREKTGSLGPLRSDDVIVKLIAPGSTHPQDREKVTIKFLDSITNQVLGQRTIPLVLILGEKDSSDSPTLADFPTTETEICRHDTTLQLQTGNSLVMRYYILMMSTVMLFSLLLPTRRDPPEESSIPLYLHISESVKMIFSYILGIVTVLLIKNT